MEVSITKISRNGQVVIPFEIREALGIMPSEKFLVVSEGDTIMLKRLKGERLVKEMESAFSYFTRAFAKAGITKEDALKEIEALRQEKRGSRAGGR